MPSVIADTHALIWYLLDSSRLSAPASEQFERSAKNDATVGVSSISIVEIIYLLEKGRIPLEALTLLTESLTQESGLLEIIPVTYAIALAVTQVPREQVSDLPDRVIAATALYLGVPLISRDRKIQMSDVETIW